MSQFTKLSILRNVLADKAIGVFISVLVRQTHAQITAFTVYQGHNGTFFAFAYDRARFPVTQPASLRYHLWTFINRSSVGYLTAFVIAAVAFFTAV